MLKSYLVVTAVRFSGSQQDRTTTKPSSVIYRVQHLFRPDCVFLCARFETNQRQICDQMVYTRRKYLAAVMGRRERASSAVLRAMFGVLGSFPPSFSVFFERFEQGCSLSMAFLGPTTDFAFGRSRALGGAWNEERKEGGFQLKKRQRLNKKSVAYCIGRW